MIDTEKFFNTLINNELSFFVGVPDSLLKNLCSCIATNCDNDHNIIAANEGNAIAIAGGYYLSSKKIGVVYMQNSGEGNAINPLLSFADEEVFSIPMLLIIGLRGEPGIKDEPQHVKQGKVTIPILEACGIDYLILNENYESQIDYAIKYMKDRSKPFAIIVRKDTFSKYTYLGKTNSYTITREEAIEAIVNNLDNNKDFIVSTTGKTSREFFEIREKYSQSHENDFLVVGSMGHTASIAYGICLGLEKKDKNIFCLDGDGSFIMHMGSLGVICSNMPSNFRYILNVNDVHESVGGQPNCADKIHIEGLLINYGFNNIYSCYSVEDINNKFLEFKKYPRSAMILYTRPGSRNNLGRPTLTPKETKTLFMEKIGK